MSHLDTVLADWESGYVRAEGDWARIDGAWLALPRGFKPAAEQVYVFPAHADEGGSYLVDTTTFDVVERPRSPMPIRVPPPHHPRSDRRARKASLVSGARRCGGISGLDLVDARFRGRRMQAARGNLARPAHRRDRRLLEVPLASIEGYGAVVSKVTYVREGFA